MFFELNEMNTQLCNLLASLKNGSLAKKQKISVKKFSQIEEFLSLLWKEGFILGYEIDSDKNTCVFLKYSRNLSPAINTISVLSKPGKKIYLNYNELCKLKHKNKLYIISTDKGLKSLNFCVGNKVGGLMICAIN